MRKYQFPIGFVLSFGAAAWVSAQPAMAQQSVVSACAGVSLPRSVVTDILSPVIGGVVQPLEGAVNPLLAVVDTLTGGLLPGPLSIDASGLLANAAAGDPITLSVLGADGTIIGPSDECITSSDGVTLDEEAGIAIGGNQITGLGQNGVTASASDIDAIALGNSASTGAGAVAAIAVGEGASVAAGATGGVALGQGAAVNDANGVALGAASITGADLAAPAYNPGSTALGGATAVGEVSIGSAGAERRITNVAAGSLDTDAANVAQLRSLDAKFTKSASWAIRYDSLSRDVATLQGANGTRITNLSDGVLNATSTDAVNGSQLNATNQALLELSQLSVQYDTDGDGNKSNSVSLKGGDNSQPVRVRNVAAGLEPTDAVNVAQLEAATVNNNAYIDQEISSVRSEARQAAAVGLAAASLRFDDRPGKFSVGVAGGAWRGQAAAAFGMGYTSETGNIRANATATTAGGAWGAGGGVSFTLN